MPAIPMGVSTAIASGGAGINSGAGSNATGGGGEGGALFAIDGGVLTTMTAGVMKDMDAAQSMFSENQQVILKEVSYGILGTGASGKGMFGLNFTDLLSRLDSSMGSDSSSSGSGGGGGASSSNNDGGAFPTTAGAAGVLPGVASQPQNVGFGANISPSQGVGSAPSRSNEGIFGIG